MMFVLLLLYSVIYFCRTGDLVPFLGRVPLLAAVRHEALVAVLVLVVVVQNEEARRNLVGAFRNGAWKTYTLFVVLAGLSIPFAAWPGNAFDWFVDFFKLFLFCVMIVGAIRSEREFDRFVLVYLICMAYVAIGPIQNYLAGNFMYDYATGTHRIGSPIRFYKNPNVLAVTLLQCVPFIYYRMVCTGFLRKKLFSILSVASITTMLFVVVITGSRGAVLVVIGMAAMICWRSRYRTVTIVVGLVLAAVAWGVIGPEYQQRYLTIGEFGESDKPAMDRILGLKHGFLMMLAHPISGVGIGCYHHARWHMFEYPLWAHSLPGQLMGELGIPGTITFIVFLWLCYRNTRATRRLLSESGMQSDMLYYCALAIEASLFAQIINGIAQHSLYLFGFYVMGALSVVLLRLAEKKVAASRPEQERNDEKGPDRRVLLPADTGKRRLPAT